MPGIRAQQTVTLPARRVQARGPGLHTDAVFGIASSILALSGKSPSGPSGGAPDGYGLRFGAAGPGGGASEPHGATPSSYPGRDHP